MNEKSNDRDLNIEYKCPFCGYIEEELVKLSKMGKNKICIKCNNQTMMVHVRKIN